MSHRARVPACILLVMTAGLVGCGGGPQADPAKTNLQQLAVLCGRYTGQNKGKMPATLDELKKFAKSQPAAGEASGDDLFVSPRDQEPYVLVPLVRMTMPGVGEKKIVLHEKTGVSGRRYVAYTTVEIEEVDESRFQELISGK